jgi:hypothetical protein
LIRSHVFGPYSTVSAAGSTTLFQSMITLVLTSAAKLVASVIPAVTSFALSRKSIGIHTRRADVGGNGGENRSEAGLAAIAKAFSGKVTFANDRDLF